MRSQQPLHLHRSNDIRDVAVAVLLLVVDRCQFKAGGQDSRFGFYDQVITLLKKIDSICWTRLGTLTTQHTIFHVHHGKLGDGV